ncbi:MAG: CDP-alcohol phosphatidyltransferase family protein [Dehalococcoidales bacterium]
MTKLASIRKTLAKYITEPIVTLVAKTPLTPNIITLIGFIITIGAGALVVTEHFLAAGIIVLVAGLFDMLDGALARMTNKTTRFGAILDSTLDRISEAILLISLLAVFARSGLATESILSGVALVGSLLVSYIRARMEGLGVECKAGLFTRPERVIILALGLMLSQFANALLITLSVLTFFSWFTVIERMVFAWNKLKE